LLVKINAEKNHQLMFYWIPFVLSLMRMCNGTSKTDKILNSRENNPMSNQETIRVGIIGAGKNTRDRHIPGLRTMDNVEIVSLVNRTVESSQNVADAFNIPQVYANWRDLVYADDTDAIVIGTWPYMHHPITLAALDAGKHVMVEARMAMNATEAKEMATVASQHPELITQIVASPMTLHLDNTIKRLITEGYLGNILAVDVRVNNSFADYDSPVHWRDDAKLSGMNIMSMGIWYEALMRWVGTAKSVMAIGKTVVKMRQNTQGNQTVISVPDHLNIIGDMVCGAQLSMTLSSVRGLAGGETALLHGTEGTLQIQGGKLFGGKRGDTDLSEIEIPEGENGGWRVEEEFIQAIRGQEVITHTTFNDGLSYMEFTEAVHRSMASRKMVAVALPS
jgi:predicted dehydrogenase